MSLACIRLLQRLAAELLRPHRGVLQQECEGSSRKAPLPLQLPSTVHLLQGLQVSSLPSGS